MLNFIQKLEHIKQSEMETVEVEYFDTGEL